MSMYLAELKRLLSKPLSIVSLAIVSLVISCSTAYAQVSMDFGFPRNGSYCFTYDSLEPINLDNYSAFAADTDESAKEVEIFASGNSLCVDITAPGGLTREPHDLDAGDWAHAVAIFPKINDTPFFGAPLAFFQVRIAGSNAKVLDPLLSSDNLASLAVAADMWTSTDDYFEFPGWHGWVYPKVQEPSGPDSFASSVLPEPTTLAMLCLATCCFPSRLLRQRR